jgi:hypothetical protein
MSFEQVPRRADAWARERIDAYEFVIQSGARDLSSRAAEILRLTAQDDKAIVLNQ